jgi:hypothetical protein
MDDGGDSYARLLQRVDVANVRLDHLVVCLCLLRAEVEPPQPELVAEQRRDQARHAARCAGQ